MNINGFLVLYIGISGIRIAKGIEGMTLQLVQMLYRHGDRTPVSCFPTNPVPESAWPYSYGQLTTLGMRQHRDLGRFFRQYYSKFLSAVFNNTEIYVRSTDYDRTIMSAQSHLYGLVQPRTSLAIDPDISWQPIPVHTVPIHLDTVLGMHGAYCARAKQISDRFFQSSLAVSLVTNRYQNLLSYISRYSGRGASLFDAWAIHDCLSIQRFYNYSLPTWYTEDIRQKLKDLNGYQFVLRFHDQDVIRLLSGPLLKTMLENIATRVTGVGYTGVKVYMYSAHDSTVSTFLKCLRVYNGLGPPYTATVVVELHKDNLGNHFVRVLYKNSSALPHSLTIPGCYEYCPLARFITLTKPMVPVDREAECRISSYAIFHIDLIWMVILIQSAVLLLFFCRSMLSLKSSRMTFNIFSHSNVTSKES